MSQVIQRIRVVFLCALIGPVSSAVAQTATEREKQEKYLQGYLDREAHFDIFWGDLYQFAQELRS